MKTIINNGYQISSIEINILIELLKNDNTINWFNFKSHDIFYNENGEAYYVIINDKKEVILYKDVIMQDLINKIETLKNQCYLILEDKQKLYQLELSLWLDYKIKLD